LFGAVFCGRDATDFLKKKKRKKENKETTTPVVLND